MNVSRFSPIRKGSLLLPSLCGLFLVLGLAQPVWARDVFVLISGGDSPMDNNYSQYLQARGVATWLERNYPPDSVWIFFGAGNIEGQPAIFGDVRRQDRRDGLLVDSWLAGALRRNQPARREIILRALREEILPAVADGGTLFLFVGDHGEFRERRKESIINLWSLERDGKSARGWRANDDEILGVRELRRLLAGGLGKGKMVFCMTQCHAGGFHYLAIPRAMTPNPAWFADKRLPDWVEAASEEESSFPRVAGFTATDEASPAAGCDPAPTPEVWSGYERFVPEKLFGFDLFTLTRRSAGLRSFAEAHVAATLVDQSIDNPYSTSEQYLERWAHLIETRLIKEQHLTTQAKKGVELYQRILDGAATKSSNRAFRERQAQFTRFTKTLAEQNVATKELLLTGSRRQLELTINPREKERDKDNKTKDPGSARTEEAAPRDPAPTPPRSGRRRASAEQRKLWQETVRPAWQTAVANEKVSGLLGHASEFEKHLLQEENNGQDFFFVRRDTLIEEAFWCSGYSDPQTVDVKKAEAVARWALERRRQIVAWASIAQDETLRHAAETLAQSRAARRPEPAPPVVPGRFLEEPIDKQTAAERVLFYRRVLGAWQFLLALDHRPALERVNALTELERTSLPRPSR